MTGEPRPSAGNTVIESLGVYLPERSVTTEEVLKNCNRRIHFPLESITGIHSRRVAAAGEFAIDLARQAVKRCFEMSKYGPEDVDLLICCNISRYDGPRQIWFEPSTAVRLRHEFGFRRALTMDLSNACAGAFTAISVGEAFLRAGAADCIMVVSGEHITHLTETAQRELKGFTDPRLACLTLGDSGIALILESGPDQVNGLHALDLFTLGQYSDYCIGRASEKSGAGAIMLTDALRLSSVAIKEATEHAVDVQSKGGWAPELMSHLIMHQTSDRTIREALGRVNKLYGKPICSERNVVFNLASRGNTATTSHFVAFNDKVLEGTIQPGDNILFSVNASGLTIGTAVYKCDQLPDRIRAHHQKGTNGSKPAVAERRRREPRGETPSARVESIGTIPADLLFRRDTLELSTTAAENCLEHSRYDRRELDLLLYSGIYKTGHVCEPSIASMVAGKLALNHKRQERRTERTFCFDILSGPIGTLKACHVASEAIRSKRHNRAMIVASEVESNAEDPDGALLGLRETASSMILVPAGESGSGFGSFRFRYFTEHIGSYSASVDLSFPGGRVEISKSPNLNTLYVDALTATIDEHLACVPIDRSRIKAVFAPQISSDFLKCLGWRTRLDCPLVDVTAKSGDLFTSSIPYALDQAVRTGLVASGDVGLMVGVAGGIQAGCVLYYF